MRIQVLGPIRAWRGDDELDLGGVRQRAVLGLLAVAGGRPLSRSELVDALWPHGPPATVANVIQTYVKHLRRVAEPDRPLRAGSRLLPTVGDGYALSAEAEVDLVDFRRLVADAVGAGHDGDHRRVAELLGRALALWRAEPLADVPFLASHPKVVALADERRAAVLRYGASMIAAGTAAEALATLEEQATRHPLDEAAQALLIRALHAAGQRQQAFAVYHATSERLADELGIDPGSALQAAHTELLSLPGRPTSGTAGSVVPRQLPPAIPHFVGRAAELRDLTDLLDRARRSGGAVMIAAIDGPAGIGKTALAMRWAHRVAERFPDGQLYVNLKGFDRAGKPMEPGEALDGFLAALGITAGQIPANLSARAALYRSLLADRRMLVVLDNARDADQVDPLLPGSAGCLVVVTSRNRLTTLLAAGAHPVTVDLLSQPEATELLAGFLGARRTAAEPDAVDDIITACGLLPLALAIVAARAAAHPAFSLAELAGELRLSDSALDPLDGGDLAIRAVFSWSYDALSVDAARLYRLLGLHPGPDLAAATAASLAGRTVAEVRPLLIELANAHLVAEHLPGRFTLHDLLRAYAREQCHTVDSQTERCAAVRRMNDQYLHTAYAAARLLNPQRTPIALPEPAPDVAAVDLRDHRQALRWFIAERPALMSLLDHQADQGQDGHVWRLAWCLADFFGRQGHWPDWVATHEVALAAGRRLASPAAQAQTHLGLGRAYSRLDQGAAAERHLRSALDLFHNLGDRRSQADASHVLALLFERQGEHIEAVRLAHRALDLYRAAGHRNGQARVLNGVGWHHALLGDHHAALRYCEQALALVEEIGDPVAEAAISDSLGYVNHCLRRYPRALAYYDRALALCRENGNRPSEAETLTHLGDTLLVAGDPDAARRAWRDALTILEELGEPNTEPVREKLLNSRR